MDINFIDMSGIVEEQSDGDKLLKTLEQYIKGCDNASIRYDIICSIFRQRRRLKLKNKSLVDFINKFKPQTFCVYQLLRDGEVVYVGSSITVETRVVAHFKDKGFNEVTICQKDTKEEMLNLENSLILKLNPEYNKSANLKRSNSYNSDPFDEIFTRYEDFLIESPVRKNAGNVVYTSLGVADLNTIWVNSVLMVNTL